jgi:hypothetical protein
VFEFVWTWAHNLNFPDDPNTDMIDGRESVHQDARQREWMALLVVVVVVVVVVGPMLEMQCCTNH